MRNLFILAAALVVMSVGVANADYSGTTASTSAWTVADMGTLLDPNLGNVYCFPGDYDDLKEGEYNPAHAVTNLAAGWATSFLQSGNDAAWISSSEDIYGNNGFYAYKTGFGQDPDLVIPVGATAEIFTAFQAYILSDDHIDGIYLNGTKLNADIVADTDGKGWYVSVNFILEGMDMEVDDMNDLIFVAHNTHSEGNFHADPNPTGLAVEYRISTGFKYDVDTVPEPATLAVIGLGLLGAGFVARRRK